MSHDISNTFEGEFAVSIMYASGECVNFNCERFTIVNAHEFKYEFEGLTDEDGEIVHFNYDPGHCVQVLINDISDEEDEED
jgi:hypothetical protein